jgi:iron complex outermembrane recepter protein
MNSMKKFLSATALTQIALCGQANAAQAEASATAAEPAAAQNERSAPVRASQEASAGSQLEDIIVTAQKRDETAQRAPVAITVVSQDELTSRGVTDITRMNSLLPSARFNIEHDIALLYIRGVGTGFSNSMVKESVGIQLNGVYNPLYATGGAMFDVARVEVLKGPQGTLYGRAAIGGIAAITSNRPSMKQEMDASLEVGNYGLMHFTGALNAPLGNDVALRGAVDVHRHGGFNSNGTENRRAAAGRVSLLATPSDDLSIYLWGQYYRNRYRGSVIVYRPGIETNLRNVPDFDPNGIPFYGPPGLDNRSGLANNKVAQAGAQIDKTVGDVEITYIPGYVWNHEVATLIVTGLAVPVDHEGKQLTNELRFGNASPGNLKWLFGLYQFHNSNHSFYTPGLDRQGRGIDLAGADIKHKTDAYAVFGEGTYSVTDGLRFTLGGRYSHERTKTTDAKLTAPTIIPFAFNQSWQHFDWKVSAEADVGPRSMVYANVQTGFNPGQFEASFPNQGAEVGAQKMLGFTAGSKNRFLDNRLQLNLELFYYRYTDQILLAFDVFTSAARAFNAPRSKSYGAELSSVWAVDGNTQINLTAGYNKAQITDFVTGTRDYSGLTLPHAPKLTIQAGFQRLFPLASGASIKLSANSYFSSGFWAQFEHPEGAYQKRYTKTDVNLSYRSVDERFEIGLWVRNLENRNVLSQASIFAGSGPFAAGVLLEAPRTYGLRTSVKF